MVTPRPKRTVPETLTLQQVLRILKEVDFEEAILVGGQAVLLYANVYGLSEKIELGVSGDIDLLARGSCALALKAKFKNSKVSLATIDDNTINTAVLAVDLSDTQFLQVDFLREVSGLDTERIRDRVVEIELEPGVNCKIINPLDLLSSKLYNLANIPSKRDTQGINQAFMALDIAEQYLKQALENADPRHSSKIVEVFFRNCCQKYYVACDVKYGMRAFSLMDSLDFHAEGFTSKRLPQMRAYYQKLRDKHLSGLSRTAQSKSAGFSIG